MSENRSELAGRVEEALRGLDAWRAETGWAGPDEYHPGKDLRHPMAVGAFGRGYALLLEMTGEDRWRATLEEACAVLAEDSNGTGRYRHANWGYPFTWDAYPDNPVHFPYLITTTHAGLCLLDAYKATGDARWLEMAIDAGRWALEEDGWIEIEDVGICFRYSPCKEHREKIIHNINAAAAGFLARLAAESGEAAFAEPADRAAALECEAIGLDGSWTYVEPAWQSRPESHTGYNIEGLCLYALVRPEKAGRVRAVLRRGGRYYMEHQYDGGRALRENDASHMNEALLWGHGWGIGAFALLHRVTGEAGWLDQAVRAAEWSLENLRKPSGAFRFQSTNDAEYLRCEAHMFYGLAYLLRELRK
jgi:hypothetical protein